MQTSKSLTPENDVRRNAPDASQLPTSAATATATRLGMRGHSHHHQITISSSTSTSSTTLLPVLLHPRDQERPRTSQPGVGHIELCLRAVEKGRLRSRSSQQRSPEDRRNASEWDTPQESERTIAKLWPRLWEPIFDVTLIIHKPPPGGRAFCPRTGQVCTKSWCQTLDGVWPSLEDRT